MDGKRCFVIPLDRDAVIFLPSFVLDMARRMTNKHTDVRVIVKTMKIQFPRLQDMSSLGESIARECNSMKTYSLVKANLGPGTLCINMFPLSEYQNYFPPVHQKFLFFSLQTKCRPPCGV